MMQERVEGRWLDCFRRVFTLNAIGKGTRVALLSETQSRPVLIHLSELALHDLGAAFCMMLGERDQMLDIFEHPSEHGMVADLIEFSWDYADTVLRPDLLSLARLIIGEVQRFPEIGRAYQEVGPDRLLRGIMSRIAS